MMKLAWIYPLIILGGVLQTCGAAMNAQLFASVENRWLANVISFALILAFFLDAFVVFPTPFLSLAGLSGMPWWAPLGGLVGAVQVYAGLTLVHRVGAGAFIGLTVTAALLMSLLLDHSGWLNVPVHAINGWRIAGAVLMIFGIILIARR
jgi:bacterial/archaeal transporter family-2 protein